MGAGGGAYEYNMERGTGKLHLIYPTYTFQSCLLLKLKLPIEIKLSSNCSDIIIERKHCKDFF